MNTISLYLLLQLVLLKSFLCEGEEEFNNEKALTRLNFGRRILQSKYQFEVTKMELPGCNSNVQDCGQFDTECTDMLLPGTSDCTSIISLNLCDQDNIKGIFCQLSCGDCLSSAPIPISTPAPAPTPTPTPSPRLTRSPSPSPSSSQGGCDEADAISCDTEGLLALKSSVKRGEDILSSWVGDDPCSWKYVICNRVDGTNKRVIVLDFDFYQTSNEFKVSATLVPDLSKLRYLEILEINSQNVTGQLHKEFSVLNRLTKFRIYRTYDITGTLPNVYSTFTNLQEFVISFNQLTGTVPPNYSTWNSLNTIILILNQLTSIVPVQFSMLTNLNTFAAASNQLTGQLPPQFSEWRDCRIFYVYRNRLTGILPVQYSVMSNMNEFWVYDNKISGNLPVEFSEWLGCEGISVWGNFLSGTLPKQYSTFRELGAISVAENRLTGSYPEEYSTWIKLERFESQGNRITGGVPPEWSTFSDSAEVEI